MSAILNITNAYAPATAHRVPARTHVARTAPPDRTETDTVEFSQFGQALAEAAEKSSLRLARLRAIRAEIESGRYETSERIAETARRLLSVLR
jgi:anti-sigma28 factor (negative regulator of flagellin synthesis)